jgi:hypothetical protein
MNAHFCAGQLQDFSFFTKAPACEMEMPVKPACHQSTHSLDFKSCCDDASYSSELTDVVPTDKMVEQSINSIKFIAIFTQFFAANLIELNAASYANYYQYLPPLIDKDIPVLVQSFLI